MKKSHTDKSITELLDTVIAINGEMIPKNGEDCYFYSFNEFAGMLTVCDGCGGLGALKYPSFENKTGAYIAARAVAYALNKWFNDVCEQGKFSNILFDSELKEFIQSELGYFSKHSETSIKIKGSMVRKFPTTIASAFLSVKNCQLNTVSLWAGDSRVYMLDNKGLAQISVDDLDSTDALSNLTDDGVLKNVVSSDGNYLIHAVQNTFSMPCIVFTATDGCFGYISTPMQFEYMLLESLFRSNNVNQWENNLKTLLKEISGDDHTMCMALFGYNDFEEVKKYFRNRIEYVESKYIRALENSDSAAKISLWQDYQKDYYRYQKSEK